MPRRLQAGTEVRDPAPHAPAGRRPAPGGYGGSSPRETGSWLARDTMAPFAIAREPTVSFLSVSRWIGMKPLWLGTFDEVTSETNESSKDPSDSSEGPGAASPDAAEAAPTA